MKNKMCMMLAGLLCLSLFAACSGEPALSQPQEDTWGESVDWEQVPQELRDQLDWDKVLLPDQLYCLVEPQSSDMYLLNNGHYTLLAADLPAYYPDLPAPAKVGEMVLLGARIDAEEVRARKMTKEEYEALSPVPAAGGTVPDIFTQPSSQKVATLELIYSPEESAGLNTLPQMTVFLARRTDSDEPVTGGRELPAPYEDVSYFAAVDDVLPRVVFPVEGWVVTVHQQAMEEDELVSVLDSAESAAAFLEQSGLRDVLAEACAQP